MRRFVTILTLILAHSLWYGGPVEKERKVWGYINVRLKADYMSQA